MKNTKMIEITVGDSIRKTAANMYDKFREEGGGNYGSIRKGTGAYCGFLGELAAMEYFGDQFYHNSRFLSKQYDYDITAPNGAGIEVKTVEGRTKPKMQYEGSVTLESTKQKCQIYLFTRTMFPRFRSVWLMGYVKKEIFMRDSVLWEKDKFDPSNGYRVSKSCYKMKYIDMLSPIDIVERYAKI